MALKKSASSTVKKLYNKASQNYSAKLAGSKSLLYNKFVLYAAFIVCLINLLIWLFSGEFIHVAVFLLVGYLTTYFSKNMIVILVISLVVSNVVKSGTSIVLEGMVVKEGNEEGVYHTKEGSTTIREGRTDYINNQRESPPESQEGADPDVADQEGADPEGADTESYEGVDTTSNTCMVDKDCESGYKCNDKYVCVSAK